MKIKINKQPQGSILLVTMLTAFIVGMALASYLTLVSVQNQSTLRSLSWNSSVPAMEAGVEEALTALQYYGTTNLVAGGWSMNSSDGFYHKNGRLPIGNSYDGYSYDAGIKPPPLGGKDQPTIECLGYAPVPANLVTSYKGLYGMILGGLVPSYTPDVSTAKRKVRVVAVRRSPFDYSILTKGQIDLNGNNIATDSFDCSDPTTKKDKGNVATNSGLVNSINAGNADIKGHVSTGPHGSVSIGPNGSIGDTSWVDQGNKGIKTGWISDDTNVDIPPVNPPFTSGYSSAGSGKYPMVTGPSYDYVFYTSGQYRLSSFSGKVMVASNAVVTLLVDSSFSFTGQDQITISPGATLKVYVAASSASIAGNGVVNQNGDALAFQYYGLPSNTSLSFNGNAAFTGVIYAPNADFTLGGGGNNTSDFVGACVAKTVKMNGHFHFHYPECLADQTPFGGYVVYSWNEVSPN